MFKKTVKKKRLLSISNFLCLHPYIFKDLKTREGWIAQRAHLYVWAAAEDELTSIGTCGQSFNL